MPSLFTNQVGNPEKPVSNLNGLNNTGVGDERNRFHSVEIHGDNHLNDLRNRQLDSDESSCWQSFLLISFAILILMIVTVIAGQLDLMDEALWTRGPPNRVSQLVDSHNMFN